MELKRIDPSSRSRARRGAALEIYNHLILPEAQNPEKQIIYWIENSKDRMADQFNCFSIHKDDKVCGYLQFSYFNQENVIFLEYLCVKSRSKQGLAPTAAIKSIGDYLAANYPCDVKIVFEVARTKSPRGDWQEDKKLVSYFERQGFRKINFAYRYPALQTYQNASFPADLMLNTLKGQKKIASNDLRNILRCIYFKHYLNWDRPFLSAGLFADREKFIDHLYQEQIARLEKESFFDTEGDDKRSIFHNALRKTPSVGALASLVFGPKLPRICVVIVITIAVEKLLGSVLLLIPIVLIASAIYCLAEDTDASRRLFSSIISRLRIVKPRSS